MPLDAQAAWLLRMMETAHQPALESLTVAEARTQYAKLMRLADAKPAPIARVENRPLPGPDGDLGARLYHPSAPKRPLTPALLFFHGGGGVIGSVETHDPL